MELSEVLLNVIEEQHPVATLIKKTKSLGDDQEDVKDRRIKNNMGLLGQGSSVDLPFYQLFSGAGMTFAAGPCKIAFMNRGIRVRRRQDIVRAVATGAIRNGCDP